MGKYCFRAGILVQNPDARGACFFQLVFFWSNWLAWPLFFCSAPAAGCFLYSQTKLQFGTHHYHQKRLVGERWEVLLSGRNPGAESWRASAPCFFQLVFLLVQLAGLAGLASFFFRRLRRAAFFSQTKLQFGTHHYHQKRLVVKGGES